MARRPPIRGHALQKGIIDRAQALGWRAVHFRKAQVRPGVFITAGDGDITGFPDIVFVRDRIVVAEIKGDGDRLRPEQQEWIDAFLMAGVEAYVWTPKSWPDEIELVLRRRGPVT